MVKESPAKVAKVVKQYGFYMPPGVRKSYDKERKGYNTSKKNINFWHAAPIPKKNPWTAAKRKG